MNPRTRVPARVEIDVGELDGPVARATGGRTRELADWQADPIHAPFNQATGGLYRVSGMGSAAGEGGRWSLILKTLRASDGFFGGSPEPGHANYWKRELLIYQSGLLERLPGIRAPRCFGTELTGASTARIWLEDIAGGAGSRWPLAQYGVAARCLGVFNGAYLAGRPLPTADCLSRQWLRALVATFEPTMATLQAVREHPLVRRCWPGDLLDRTQALWEERDMFLDALEGLPQTFCHLDAFPRNLLIDQDSKEVVAIDWSYAGIGAVGSELAPMVAASVCFQDAEPEEMATIDQFALDGYIAGLRAAGWGGSRDLARLGYTAAAALHYGLFPMGLLMMDKQLRVRLERLFGHPAAAVVDRWAKVSSFLLEQADEARDLVRTTGVLQTPR